jgi:hypothetical protein
MLGHGIHTRQCGTNERRLVDQEREKSAWSKHMQVVDHHENSARQLPRIGRPIRIVSLDKSSNVELLKKTHYKLHNMFNSN